MSDIDDFRPIPSTNGEFAVTRDGLVRRAVKQPGRGVPPQKLKATPYKGRWCVAMRMRSGVTERREITKLVEEVWGDQGLYSPPSVGTPLDLMIDLPSLLEIRQARRSGDSFERIAAEFGRPVAHISICCGVIPPLPDESEDSAASG